MQESDFKWYKENFRDLFQKFGEKFVAIKNETVLGVYDTYADGVIETSKHEELGTFIVQQCGADESAYTCQIASMNFL